jgi:hypothetical protein
MLNANDTLPLQKEKTNKRIRPTLGQHIAGRVLNQGTTVPNSGTPTSRNNAADWNKPGGGYDRWKQGDAQREQDANQNLPPRRLIKPWDEE